MAYERKALIHVYMSSCLDELNTGVMGGDRRQSGRGVLSQTLLFCTAGLGPGFDPGTARKNGDSIKQPLCI